MLNPFELISLSSFLTILIMSLIIVHAYISLFDSKDHLRFL